jgi:hypothetical protein
VSPAPINSECSCFMTLRSTAKMYLVVAPSSPGNVVSAWTLGLQWAMVCLVVLVLSASNLAQACFLTFETVEDEGRCSRCTTCNAILVSPCNLPTRASCTCPPLVSRQVYGRIQILLWGTVECWRSQEAQALLYAFESSFYMKTASCLAAPSLLQSGRIGRIHAGACSAGV